MTRRQPIDITGKRYGRWTVIAYARRIPWATDHAWECVCDCGVQRINLGSLLRNGDAKSCGDCGGLANLQHGMTGSREYRSWLGMRARCFDPGHRAYERYGARGISVCEEWANSFAAFYADMGKRPEGCSLDRIDNDDGYRPGNVRWATSFQQAQNRRPPKKRKRRRSTAKEIRAYAASLARAASAPSGVAP
jgi:hypothetical protein